MTSQQRLRPNFFIIGAPRCGTTALSSYLGEHPQILFSEPKEPLFFCTDLPGLRYVTSTDEYLNECFSADPGDNYAAVGEGSVWYLYSDEALANILEFDPRARFIIMLRNPVDMLASLHQKLFTFLDEDQPDFARAWELQAQRREGQSLPPKCREPRLLQYAEIGRFGRQLSRVFAHIAPANRLVILFDDFVHDTRRTYQQVLRFLEIAGDGRDVFPQVNENLRVRSRFLLEQAAAPPAGLMRSIDRAKRLFGIEKLAVLPRLRAMLTVAEQRPPQDHELRGQIIAELSEDIDLLAQLLDRDLTHWKQLNTNG